MSLVPASSAAGQQGPEAAALRLSHRVPSPHAPDGAKSFVLLGLIFRPYVCPFAFCNEDKSIIICRHIPAEVESAGFNPAPTKLTQMLCDSPILDQGIFSVSLQNSRLWYTSGCPSPSPRAS